MNFGYGKNDSYKGERFITFTEAAEILNFNSHTKISTLVDNGLLETFTLPLTTRARVRKSKILNLSRMNLNQIQFYDFEI